MDSADFPGNSRESPRISQETHSPTQETHSPAQEAHSAAQEAHSPGFIRLDILALVAAEELQEELGLDEASLDTTRFTDFLGVGTGNQRDSSSEESGESDSLSDESITARTGRERRQISESEREYMYKTAKRFARELHDDADEYAGLGTWIPRERRVRRNKEGDEKEEIAEFEGPFRDAINAIEKRNSSKEVLFFEDELDINLRTRVATSLKELCVRQLGKNFDALVSLQSIPDELRSKIANEVSRSGEINARFMKLLVMDSPVEINVKNCTNLEEKDLIEILCDCDTEMLRVLKLDLCGRAMTEHMLRDFLSRSPKGFPILTKLSLKGAFSLTNKALALISKSAPLLQHLDLSDCSLLTDKFIKTLLGKFRSSLEGLSIAGCLRISPPFISCYLKRFKNLTSLSLARLKKVDDNFLVGFIEARGFSLTRLSLASCTKVSDESMKAIGIHCTKLRVLDISFLGELTDLSLQYIANGCRHMCQLKCCRNRFSDMGISAFLEVSGRFLTVLSLNSVRKVDVNTAISVAKVCKQLRSLDLSWCRKLKDEHLRLIFSSCLSLTHLRLFGCSQITEKCIEELSRSRVQIIGTRTTQLLDHLNDFEEAYDSD